MVCLTVWSSLLVDKNVCRRYDSNCIWQVNSRCRGGHKSNLTNVKQWFSANRLSLNLVKTEYLLIGSRYNTNNLLAAPNVFVGDTPIKKVKETKALGVHIDEFLSWDKHIDKIAKKISSGIGAIRKLKYCVDHNTLIHAYNALILPHLDYCCDVWDTIGATLSDRLQKLQNWAARVITGRKMRTQSIQTCSRRTEMETFK
jgi:hypothetical protein